MMLSRFLKSLGIENAKCYFCGVEINRGGYWHSPEGVIHVCRDEKCYRLLVDLLVDVLLDTRLNNPKRMYAQVEHDRLLDLVSKIFWRKLYISEHLKKEQNR